jgi:ribose transport system permease protein
VARLGSASPSLGSGLLLDTMAAIVVGGTSLAAASAAPSERWFMCEAAFNPSW